MFDNRMRAAHHEAKRRPYGAVADITSTLNAAALAETSGEDAAKNPLAALDAFLQQVSFDAADPLALGDVLRQMVDGGLDRLPLPGSGQTLTRWRALAAVAARDLGLVKLFEAHTDALAILAELGAFAVPSASLWGVWAAEAPDARVVAQPLGGGELRLNGVKAWCSGAIAVTHALVTAWLGDEPVLATVALDQPSVSISAQHWHAVGMAATASADVRFDGTRAVQLGAAHSYVGRPGFWQGGAGIAACWYGAAAGVASMMAEALATRHDAHRLAHLGAVEVALAGAAAVLRETAAQIDADPTADMQRPALRARLAVEAAATTVMEHAGRALGAAPLCRNERFARAMADLPVFLRQSHAEHDLAALAQRSLDQRRDHGDPWLL